MKFFFVLSAALLFLLASFQGVSARVVGGDGGAEGVIQSFLDINFSNCSLEEIEGIFCIAAKTINLLLGIAGGVAILFFVYGGIMYMMSGGDEKQLGNAKAAITYSVLGLLIILGAIFIVNTILAGLLG